MLISPEDALILKYPYQRVKHWAVNVFPRVVVATATLADTPTAGDYPLASLLIDSATNWPDIREDMLVEISRDGAAYFTGSLRKSYDADNPTVLYIGGVEIGESGRASEDANIFTTGDTVTVYSVRVPYAFWSRIDRNTGEPFKKWEQTVYYDDAPAISRNEYPQPVANLGAWQRVVTDGTSGRATHSAANSTVWRGSGFTVEWHLPSGATLASGYVTSDETVEIDYAPGVYVLACTVTEVGGAASARSRTGYRYVWAVGGDTPDTSDTVSVEMPTRDMDSFTDGRSLAMRFSGTNLDSILYTGAPVLMSVDYEFSETDGFAEAVTIEGTVKSFVGYVASMNEVRHDGDVQTVEVTVENPLLTCRRLGIAKQLLRVKPVGNKWFKTIIAVGHVGYVAYYLMAYHAPWLLSLHDYDYDDLDSFRAFSYLIDGRDLMSAIQRAAGYCLGGTAGCTSDGRIVLKRNFSIESDAYNAAGVEAYTLDGDVVEDAVTYSRDEYARAFDARGGFQITGSTRPIEAYMVRARLYAPGQGTQEEPIPNFIALSKPDGLERAGRYLKAANLPTESIAVALAGQQDIIDPAIKEMYRLDLNAFDAMNTGALNNRLAMARSVERRWVREGEDTLVKPVVTFIPRTRGREARVELPPDVDTSNGQPTLFFVVFGLTQATPGAGTYNESTELWEPGDVTLPNGRQRRLIDLLQYVAFPFPRVRRIYVKFNLTVGTYINPDAYCLRLQHVQTDGSVTRLAMVRFADAAEIEGVEITFTHAGAFKMQGIQISLSSSLVAAGDTPDGSCELESISYEALT